MPKTAILSLISVKISHQTAVLSLKILKNAPLASRLKIGYVNGDNKAVHTDSKRDY